MKKLPTQFWPIAKTIVGGLVMFGFFILLIEAIIELYWWLSLKN